MLEFDPGPPAAFANLFSQAPDYGPFRKLFWYDWGPIFYRGRLDGSARLLCIASDPGPTERIAGRTLVGDAGQRVQGLLAKVGLTRSYLCVNAFLFALHPGKAHAADTVLDDPAQRAWRNQFLDLAKGPNVRAIVAFGGQAQGAADRWPGKGTTPLFRVPHPSSRDNKALLDAWRALVPQLRLIITPDPDGDPTLPNYGAQFKETDYARIPARDLPFGVPPWLGDDAWGRKAKPKHNNSVSRPSPDDGLTLKWIAPKAP